MKVLERLKINIETKMNFQLFVVKVKADPVRLAIFSKNTLIIVETVLHALKHKCLDRYGFKVCIKTKINHIYFVSAHY